MELLHLIMIMNNNNYNNDNKDNIFRWYKDRIFSSILTLKFFTQYNGFHSIDT